MDYLTNYYKNLCEQLQEKINILEAGYAKAIRSGDKEKMEKELARQRYLEKFKEELSDKGIEIGTENFDVLDPEVQRLMKPSAAKRMDLVIARTGNKKGEYYTGRKGHKENMQALAMQLDTEYPKQKSRIRVADLPAQSPFLSDQMGSSHVTPSQY